MAPDSLARAAGAALREMFEPDVSVAVWGVDVVSADVYPEEAEYVRRAVESRRTEFARGRSCARTALAVAGGPPVAIPVGPGRAPRFPDGFVGTITHSGGLIAAVVARETAVAGMGVDAERIQRLGEDVPHMVLTDLEWAGWEGVEGDERRDDVAFQEHAMTIFSAKEALFKSVYPLTGAWLGFEDVALETSGSRFSVAWTAESVDAGLLQRLQGRWRKVGGSIVTACWLPPS